MSRKPLCPNGLGRRLLNVEAASYSQLCREAGSTPVRGTRNRKKEDKGK